MNDRDIPVKDHQGRIVGRVLDYEWDGTGVNVRVRIDDKDFFDRLVYGREYRSCFSVPLPDVEGR